MDQDEASGRKIIHIDMDAFFASVEQRDDPSLRGRPVAVGSPKARGVVAAASYEARKHGVRSAMPSVVAARKCKDLVFVPPRFDVYRQVSGQIHEIFAEHTPLIEPLSLDEAYLDVTENLQGIPLATDVANAIRARILEVTGLTASAGISYNKFLAKMASGMRKPNGFFVIPPQKGPAFVAALEIERFHGVGPATAGRMHSLGIRTGADLLDRSLEDLTAMFGKSGRYYYDLARGIDTREVVTSRERKSFGAEDTFPADVEVLEDVVAFMEPLIDKVWLGTQKRELHGRTVTVKIKFANFEQITRSRSDQAHVASRRRLAEMAIELLSGEHPFRMPIRLIGVSMSSFAGEESEADSPQLVLDL